MIHLTKTNKYMIGGAALLVVGYFGYSYWQKSKSSGPGPHQVQPPNSGSAYVNASFTSNSAMSTLDVQKALNDLGAQPPLVELGIVGDHDRFGVALAESAERRVFVVLIAKATPPALATAAASVLHRSLTWRDIDEIRSITSLPILLKGILHPEDVRLAVNAGVDGIIVSTHGGRQVDGSIAALDALPAVAAAVDGAIPVLFDSGVRCGADVMKALGLGAYAVLLGRPYLYGLAVAGFTGVAWVIRNLLAELHLQMALSGCASIRDVRDVERRSN
ncbi:MAG: alpha-hydroxy-acid oxidizing protein [Alicyclobacillus sp.]|nr:alpha-hydroxy-acid oxidizing protein [Alicyclobacillus sp.]